MKAFLVFLLLLLPLGAAQENSNYITVDNISFIQDGKRFYSIGINAVKIYDGPGMVAGDPVYDQRHRAADWLIELKDRFTQWGFNTIGPFSDKNLEKDFLYCHSVYFGNYSKDSPHMLADVFSEEYSKMADEYARNECQKRSEDKNLIGYFISNEIKIFGNLPWRPHSNPLLEIYLKLPTDTPGFLAAQSFVRKHYKLDYTKQCDMFAALIMDKYMSVCVAAIKKYDPNHLILGTRFASIPPDEVVRAVANHSDVLSFNLYEHDFSLIDRWNKLTNKPIMITEFSWRAIENLSGNLNTHGPDVTVNTDKDRARNYKDFINRCIESGKVVGIQWFQFYDEPLLGRNDGYGENSAYGIVSLQDEAYEALTKQMAISNKIWQNLLTK